MAEGDPKVPPLIGISVELPAVFKMAKAFLLVAPGGPHRLDVFVTPLLIHLITPELAEELIGAVTDSLRHALKERHARPAG